MIFVQGLFSGILLVDLNLLFIVVVQGPSYGRLLCFTIQMPLSCILLRQVGVLYRFLRALQQNRAQSRLLYLLNIVMRVYSHNKVACALPECTQTPLT